MATARARWGRGQEIRRGARGRRATVGGTSFDRFVSVAAILAAVAVIVANLVGVGLHPTTGLFADTISNLAAGRYHWILDAALVMFGIALVFIATALWAFDLDGWRWRSGVACIGLTGIAILVIALYNEYGDGDTGGITIHLEVVVAMGLLFTLGTILLSFGLVRMGTFWSGLNVLTGVLWLVIGLAFFFLTPDAWDGLVERIAAGMLIVWTFAMARLIGRERYPDTE